MTGPSLRAHGGGPAIITAANGTVPGEYCDCDFFDQEHPEISLEGNVPCGCGEHDINCWRARGVHWLGKHWDVWCAFQEALKRLASQS